jgi:hypothetical protein
MATRCEDPIAIEGMNCINKLLISTPKITTKRDEGKNFIFFNGVLSQYTKIRIEIAQIIKAAGVILFTELSNSEKELLPSI